MKIGCLITSIIGVIIAAVIGIGAILLFTENDYEGVYSDVILDIPDLREHYTAIKGGGADTATVMMYIIGSDLESDDGSASDDIQEILDADTSNINVVIETGGAKHWHMDAVEDGVVQRHVVDGDTLNTVDTLGAVSMVQPDTLADFITWAANEYPADRYSLILWDHGGGTALGFGCDELEADEEESLELSEIGQALKKSGIKLDVFGFDACLMGTVETAYMLEPYADYMIASEETEPGTGWYYTDWLTTYSADTSIDTVELGRKIIDDFINGPDSFFWDTNTLSVVELREIPYVYKTLAEFMKGSKQCLENNGYANISDARRKAKSFGDDNYDQIDVLSYLSLLEDVSGTSELTDAVRSCVKYTNNSAYDAAGIAMYYPYDYPEVYEDVYGSIEKFGYGEACAEFFNEFLTIMTGAQMRYTHSDSYSDSFTGGANDDDYTLFSWFDDELELSDEYENEDYSELEVLEKDGYYALSLSDEDWDMITDIGICAFVDDGGGYTELGIDNMYSFDDDGDLIVDFDNTWVSINGHIAPYNFEYESPEDENEWFTYGYVSALLNGEKEIEIMLYWDTEHEDGYIAGWRNAMRDGAIGFPAKGWKHFSDGDMIELLYDRYTYDGDYDGQYTIGEPFAIDDSAEVAYDDIGDSSVYIYYELHDIYNNVYTTEMLEYSV